MRTATFKPMLRDHYNDHLEVFHTQNLNGHTTPVFYDSRIRLLVTPSKFLHEYCEGDAQGSSGPASASSRKTYADLLVNFLNYLSLRKIDLESITFQILTGYRDDMRDGKFSYLGKKLKPSSINPRIHLASSFCDWLHQKGVLAQVATKYRVTSTVRGGITSTSGEYFQKRLNILTLTLDPNPIKVNLPTRAQLDRCCERLKDKGKMLAYQDIALKLAYKVGLRIHECAGFTCESFKNLEPIGDRKSLWQTKITGKGNKKRIIHIPRSLADLMRSYESTLTRESLAQNFLINPSAYNKTKTLSGDALGEYFREIFLPELRSVVGAPDLEITFHTLRHIYAGDALLGELGLTRPLSVADATLLRTRLGGVSGSGPSSMRTGISVGPIETALSYVQKRLGHAQLSSTEKYAEWASELVRAVLAVET